MGLSGKRDARESLRDHQCRRRRGHAGDDRVRKIRHAGAGRVEVRVREPDLVVLQVVDHVRGAQEGVAEEVGRAAGWVDAEVAGRAAVLQRGHAAVLGDDGDDELADADADGGTAGAREAKVEGRARVAQAAGHGIPVVGVIGGAYAAEDGVGILVRQVGEAGAAIEDDGDGEVGLGVLGGAGAVLHGEAGEDDGEGGDGLGFGVRLNGDRDEAAVVFGGVDAAEEDGAVIAVYGV